MDGASPCIPSVVTRQQKTISPVRKSLQCWPQGLRDLVFQWATSEWAGISSTAERIRRWPSVRRSLGQLTSFWKGYYSLTTVICPLSEYLRPGHGGQQTGEMGPRFCPTEDGSNMEPGALRGRPPQTGPAGLCLCLTVVHPRGLRVGDVCCIIGPKRLFLLGG